MNVYINVFFFLNDHVDITVGYSGSDEVCIMSIDAKAEASVTVCIVPSWMDV